MNLWRERAASGLEWFRGPRGLWATGIVVVLLVVLWLTPRRVARLVTVDGKDIGPAPAGSPTWQVGWEPAGPIEVEAADGGESVDLIAPRLVGDGQLLFLTRRGPDGQMDIFRSQLNEGSWSRAVPVAEINSGANDIGPVVSDKDAIELVDEVLNTTFPVYPDGTVTLYLPLRFQAPPQVASPVPLALTYMSCSETNCHMPVERAIVEITPPDPN